MPPERTYSRFRELPADHTQLAAAAVGGDHAVAIRLPHGGTLYLRGRGRGREVDAMLCGSGGGFCWRARWDPAKGRQYVRDHVTDATLVRVGNVDEVWPREYRGPPGGGRR